MLRRPVEVTQQSSHSGPAIWLVLSATTGYLCKPPGTEDGAKWQVLTTNLS